MHTTPHCGLQLRGRLHPLHFSLRSCTPSTTTQRLAALGRWSSSVVRGETSSSHSRLVEARGPASSTSVSSVRACHLHPPHLLRIVHIAGPVHDAAACSLQLASLLCLVRGTACSAGPRRPRNERHGPISAAIWMGPAGQREASAPAGSWSLEPMGPWSPSMVVILPQIRTMMMTMRGR